MRLYDRLFRYRGPGRDGTTPLADLNPDSLAGAARLQGRTDRSAQRTPATRFQFERHGYFVIDRDSTPGHPVFNRTVTLKDSWLKVQQKSQ